jgi:hypothetical protein
MPCSKSNMLLKNIIFLMKHVAEIESVAGNGAVNFKV